MRKQTKLVAVASAAALLAIGASMTSFAATGWVEEDGQWFFYDKDGNRVEDAWKKSGDNWYWLDSEEGGAMAVDKLIEDDDDTYYVDANGVMVRNTWVKVVNEDQDDETDPAEYNYYYMQSNGKAYKTSSDTTQFKTIDGKRYAFDEDGKMLYGWVNGNHERVDSDSWGDEGFYYLGSWDDGALKTGWQKIYVVDTEDNDEEKEFWFNFKSNGVKRFADKGEDVKEVKINGKKYGFDSRGVMTYEWTVTSQAQISTTGGWKYFNDPEDGARVTKGWFKVVAPEEDNDNTFKDYGEGQNDTFAYSDANDETERWYYANGDGELAVGEIKKIKGKYYGFRPEGGSAGAMLTGLCLLDMNDTDSSKIDAVLAADIDSDELDSIVSKDIYHASGDEYAVPAGATLFYFGNDEDTDGALKTGNVSVNLDGDTYQFQFSKSGGAEGKGRGLTGIDDNKYIYKYGMKLKASSDDKYIVVKATGDVASGNAQVGKVDMAKVRLNDTAFAGNNDDGDSVLYVGEKESLWSSDYKLINTSGAIVKDKTSAKDGADWYFYVNDSRIVTYVNNKNLKGDKENIMTVNLADWKKWTDIVIGADGKPAQKPVFAPSETPSMNEVPETEEN